MRPVTSALMAFEANLARTYAFLSIFDKPKGQPRGQGRPTDHEKELLRATVVFAIAALDAYLHDLVLEEVPKRGVQSDEMREALKAIAKDDPSLALRVALVDDRSVRIAEFRAALDSWLSSKAFQGPEAVTRALGFVGHPMTTKALEVSLGPIWAAELTDWTIKRHGMVHRAETPYIKRADAGRCVALIRKIVDAVDQVVAGSPVPIT